MSLFGIDRLCRTLLLTAALSVGLGFTSSGAFAQTQGKPKIALYIANDSLKPDEKSYITSKFLSPFTASGVYSVIDRSDIFTQKASMERIKQRDGSVSDKEIRKIGQEAGAHYVCIVDMRRAFGKWNVSARMVDVESAEIYLATGEADIIGDLANADFGRTAQTIYNNIHGIVDNTPAPPTQQDQRQEDESKIALPYVVPKQETVEDKPAVTGGANVVKGRKLDYYIAPKYLISSAPRGYVAYLGVDVEGGVIWGKGAFCGIDFGGCGDIEANSTCAGISINLGNVYDLGNNLQLVYGGSLGFWGVDGYVGKHLDHWGDWEYEMDLDVGLFAPFVKLRWNRVEVMYRMFLGTSAFMNGGDDDFNVFHQVMLGVNFATSKRERR